MARQRLTLLAIAVLVAAAAIGLVVAFVGNGGGSSTAGTTATTSGTTGNQESALKGVPQSGLRLGDAAAPATLYIFEDPQCPFCQEWSLQSVPATVNEFVKTGQISMLLQPIDILGPLSEPGVRAVYSAAKQNKAWNMMEALYQRQGKEQSGWITNDVIKASATAAGASASLVLDAMQSASVTGAWRAVELRARQWGLQGTPSFILVKQLGTPTQVNPQSLDAAGFTAALRSALQ